MRCLLAVDSGGTKCEAVLADDEGRMVGSGRRDHRHIPGERHMGGRGRADRTVTEAVAEAMRDAPTMDELHVAGRRPSHPDLLARFSAVVRYHAVGEQEAPMALAGASAGIVVLAGTGAFAYGRGRAGRELLLDALGPLYGDHGGAYQIGLAAVRAAGRADWHKRLKTSLGHVVPAACRALAGDPDNFNMVVYMLEARDRSEVASLAKLVDDEARRGDAVSRQILVDAADDMAETVRCVVERLDLAGEALPLIGTGGVAVHSATYWNRVCQRARGFAPHLQPVLVDHPQVLGLILAMAAQLGIASPEFRERLLGGATCGGG